MKEMKLSKLSVLFSGLFVISFIYGVFAEEPSIVASEFNVTARAGEQAVLPCSVNNLNTKTTRYKVIWADRWSALLTYDVGRIIDDARLRIERPYREDWNLVIDNVRYSDAGKYVCQINTKPVKTKTVVLQVLIPPTIKLHTKYLAQAPGRETILECEIIAFPMDFVVWRFNNENLVTSKKHRIEIYNDGNHRVTLSLRVMDITYTDYGNYTCFARNQLGSDQAVMQLYVTEQTPSKTDCENGSGDSGGVSLFLFMLITMFYIFM